MHYLSYTKSRRLTNTPTRFGARQHHLQGVPSQLLALQHVRGSQTSIWLCFTEMQSSLTINHL